MSTDQPTVEAEHWWASGPPAWLANNSASWAGNFHWPEWVPRESAERANGFSR